MADKTDKKAFALRIRADVMNALERWAEDEFRSLNGQIEYLLVKALRENGRLEEKKNSDPAPQEE
ncbi:Arc family DNA binding domain-containing protein [Cytophagaceae bacterium DM2B3-1]|uniref:Arc family DNA binding domain-containing protein n=1 Tax=Xanthocytophaga flava TaxID=3048013 RepID=A0AAE3QMY0_9BACT|nr:hypothetical protein [Xanthocytophaga flavus]MDJ1472676.1 Arc family DNA binding domain-containing protein [Xanthocytophaga flavus]MDJ1482302.1 Arc family DNA binding domain-containing protein [Xanthocytophaga flavus]MDJ1491856.1 Arc family DNA binding domain-containing protein [Xanthocytophaga flavus]